jgi:hypothetical protein
VFITAAASGYVGSGISDTLANADVITPSLPVGFPPCAINFLKLRNIFNPKSKIQNGSDSCRRIHLTDTSQTRDQKAGSPFRFLNTNLKFSIDLGFDSHQRIHLTGASQTLKQETGSPFRFLNIKIVS